MSAAFDYPLTAKARLSRRSRLGTHTRSIQAHFRAAQSSPPRPLWFRIADMHSRSSKGLSRHTTPCDRVRAPTPPVTTPRFATGSRRKKKEPDRLGTASEGSFATPPPIRRRCLSGFDRCTQVRRILPFNAPIFGASLAICQRAPYNAKAFV
jgi:hypothetical protein